MLDNSSAFALRQLIHGACRAALVVPLVWAGWTAAPAVALSPVAPKYDPLQVAVGTWCGADDLAPISALTVAANGTFEALEHSPQAGTWQVGTYSIVLKREGGSDADRLELKSAVAVSGHVLRYSLEPGGPEHQLRRCTTTAEAVAGDWTLHYDPSDVATRWQWPAVARIGLDATTPLQNNRLHITSGPAAGLTLINVHRQGDYLLAQTPLLPPKAASNTVPLRATVYLQRAKPGLLDLKTLLADQVDQVLLYSAASKQVAVLNRAVMEGVGQMTLAVIQAPGGEDKERLDVAQYPGSHNPLQFEALATANALLAQRGFVHLPVSAGAAPLAKAAKGKLQFVSGGRQWRAQMPTLPVMQGPTKKLKQSAAKCLYWEIDRAAPLPGSDLAAVVLSLRWKWSSSGKGPCVDRDYNDELAPEPTRRVIFAQ